ncbi:MAG: HTH-type transcriptional regulator CysB [Gammaproteobacteria bacterium]|nr:HTH-type transcriptional regulator CysB [Gammaproteobacteria bacterium]
MKLQQLRYLLAIADNGLNITAAAEKLYTSQPGVSKQLKLLEEELGLQLFLRKGKSLGAVTSAGEQVIERARLIMREAENIRSLASSYYHEEEGTLSIATTHTQARYVLPNVIRVFRNRFPRVNLKIHQGTSEQIADMVSSNNIDFAIATGSHELFRDLLLIPSFHWDRKIIVPKDHELARQKRKITLNDLARFPLVTYVFSFGGQSMLKRAFAEKGLDPDVVFTARDADVIKTYVRMGLGVGIVAGMADDQEDEDMCAISAAGLFPRSTTWIGFRKDLILRRYMLDFIRLFAPHITADQIEQTRNARSQADIDKLYAGSVLPVLTGNTEAVAATLLQSIA